MTTKSDRLNDPQGSETSPNRLDEIKERLANGLFPTRWQIEQLISRVIFLEEKIEKLMSRESRLEAVRKAAKPFTGLSTSDPMLINLVRNLIEALAAAKEV